MGVRPEVFSYWNSHGRSVNGRFLHTDVANVRYLKTNVPWISTTNSVLPRDRLETPARNAHSLSRSHDCRRYTRKAPRRPPHPDRTSFTHPEPSIEGLLDDGRCRSVLQYLRPPSPPTHERPTEGSPTRIKSTSGTKKRCTGVSKAVDQTTRCGITARTSEQAVAHGERWAKSQLTHHRYESGNLVRVSEEFCAQNRTGTWRENNPHLTSNDPIPDSGCGVFSL